MRCTVRAATASAAASEKTIVEWPSEKKKPTPSGRLPLLQQLAGGVVDRGDVVGVEGVAQTEGVGEDAEPGERRVAARVVDEQPPAGDMERRDGTAEPRQAKPLRAAQGARETGTAHGAPRLELGRRASFAAPGGSVRSPPPRSARRANRTERGHACERASSAPFRGHERSSSMSTFSRRSFFKAAGVATGTAMISISPAAPRRSSRAHGDDAERSPPSRAHRRHRPQRGARRGDGALGHDRDDLHRQAARQAAAARRRARTISAGQGVA